MLWEEPRVKIILMHEGNWKTAGKYRLRGWLAGDCRTFGLYEKAKKEARNGCEQGSYIIRFSFIKY